MCYVYNSKKTPSPSWTNIFVDFTISFYKGVLYIYIYNFPQTKTPYLKITASSNHAVISYQQVLSGSERMDVTKLA